MKGKTRTRVCESDMCPYSFHTGNRKVSAGNFCDAK